MRAVIDTQTWVTGILMEESEERRVLVLVRRRQIVPVVSVPIVDEVSAILSRFCRDGHLDFEQAMRWLGRIAVAAEPVEPEGKVQGCPDPEDTKFLEAAIYGDADIIISRDLHLLDLDGQFKTVSGKRLRVIHPVKVPLLTSQLRTGFRHG